MPNSEELINKVKSYNKFLNPEKSFGAARIVTNSPSLKTPDEGFTTPVPGGETRTFNEYVTFGFSFWQENKITDNRIEGINSFNFNIY